MVVELTGDAQDVEADWEEPGAQQSQVTAKGSPGGTAEERSVRTFSLTNFSLVNQMYSGEIKKQCYPRFYKILIGLKG